MTLMYEIANDNLGLLVIMKIDNEELMNIVFNHEYRSCRSLVQNRNTNTCITAVTDEKAISVILAKEFYSVREIVSRIKKELS